jgi:hypothetical protein
MPSGMPRFLSTCVYNGIFLQESTSSFHSSSDSPPFASHLSLRAKKAEVAPLPLQHSLLHDNGSTQCAGSSPWLSHVLAFLPTPPASPWEGEPHEGAAHLGGGAAQAPGESLLIRKSSLPKPPPPQLANAIPKALPRHSSSLGDMIPPRDAQARHHDDQPACEDQEAVRASHADAQSLNGHDAANAHAVIGAPQFRRRRKPRKDIEFSMCVPCALGDGAASHVASVMQVPRRIVSSLFPTLMMSVPSSTPACTCRF